MKLYTLISAVVLGMAVLVQAQPATAPPAPKAGVAKDPNMNADGSVTLSSGTLAGVVAEIERRMRHWTTTDGGGEPTMPNILYGTDAYNAEMPGDLRLRGVSPLQAVALAAAAADCTLEPIFAPMEAPDVPARKAIGYRIVRGSEFRRPQSSAGLVEQSLTGVGLALAKTNESIVVGQIVPGSPASSSPDIRPGQRILRVAEGDQEAVDVTGLGLEKVVQMIRGAPGTIVKLTLGGDSDKGPTENAVTLVRSRIPVLPPSGTSTAPKVRVVDQLAGGYGSSGLGGGGSSGFGGGGSMTADVPSRIKPGSATHRVPLTQSAQGSEPFVRVYAIGFIMTGTDQEKGTKVKAVDELIRDALKDARLDPNPSLNIHQRTGALVSRATAAQHEIIEQVVLVMKENATQTTVPAKP